MTELSQVWYKFDPRNDLKRSSVFGGVIAKTAAVLFSRGDVPVLMKL